MGKGVTVAVIDSGVNASHPDLSGKVSNVSVGLGSSDENGHGTHVAGIIAATLDNGLGGSGIAPKARILNVRVLDEEGKGSTDTVARGIIAAVNNGADIINLSLGSFYYSPAVYTAINYAVKNYVTVIAAMGNDGTNAICYPAAYDGVIAVVASDSARGRAYYSNYGGWADIAAPGSGIYSTIGSRDYTDMDGTSMACPVVAGAAALYKSVHPSATPAQIEARMKSTATAGDKDLGVGIINAANMLSEAPAAPGFWVGSYDTGSDYGIATAPFGSSLNFYANSPDSANYILYTLDGKMPAVKNGVVSYGTVYDSPIDLTPYAGQTITVNAIQVTTLGMVSPVLTREITVANENPLSIQITGPSTLIAGKTGEFTAVVEPADTADQTVTWSITNHTSNMSGANIDANTGKLTTPKLASGVSGSITVRATSKAYSTVKATHRVTVSSPLPVSKITLSETRRSMYVDDWSVLSVVEVLNSKNQAMDVSSVDVHWTSSNPAVATVNEAGEIHALSKGSATITCKALDGSNKSAKCTITVMQPVTEITVTGQNTIAPGTSATYKASVLPSTANNKKVNWYLFYAPPGVSIDPAKGTVSVSSSVRPNSLIYIYAASQDGRTNSDPFLITVQSKCTAVEITDFADYPGIAPGPIYDKTGSRITNVELFNVDLHYGVYYDDDIREEMQGTENQIQLFSEITVNGRQKSADDRIVWSSSNPAVASVDSAGLVTAHKAGTAKITATAMDGSKKKATVTVKVLVPASSISLSSSAPKGANGTSPLAVGKTFSHKAVLGTAYGTPSKSKLVWGFDVYTLDRYGNYHSIVQDYDNRGKYDELSKMISANGGKLSVKPTAAVLFDQYSSDIYVSIDCYDFQSGVADSANYELVMPTTYLRKTEQLYDCYKNDNGDILYYSVDFYCDQAYTDYAFSVSNPDVITPMDVKNYGGDLECLHFEAMRPGTSKITIKTVDGTNKTLTYTVKVLPDYSIQVK